MIDIEEFDYNTDVKKCIADERSFPCNKTDYGLKDVFCTKDGFTTANSRMLHNYCAPYDSTVVELLKQYQYTKVPCDEFCAGGLGIFPYKLQNPRFSHFIGGSSSGCAYYILKYEQFAIGSDTGGSIRYPSAINEIIGFKPSYGRISRYGLIALCDLLDTVGIMSKDIQTIKEIFKILDVHDDKDDTCQVNRTNVPITNYVQYIPTDEDCTCIAQLYNSLMLPFAFSNMNRFNGIAFSKLYHIEKPVLKSIRTKSRSELLGPEIKNRIMHGYSTNTQQVYNLYKYRHRISNVFLEQIPLLNKIKSILDNNTAILMPIPQPCYQYKPQDKLLPIANMLGCPSISFKYKNNYFELLGPYNSDYDLIQKYIQWF